MRYGAAIGALVVASGFLYLVPLVPQIAIDGVITNDPERASSFVTRAVELGGGREFLRTHLWIAAVVAIVLTAIAGSFTYLRGRWSAQASEAIALKVRDRLYDRLQHLPVWYFDTAKTGDLVQRCTSDVETLRQFLASQVVEIGRASFMMLLPIPLMLALDARMTLVSVVTIPPLVLFSFLFFRRVRARFKLADESEGRLTATIQENLTGIRVVRAFARQDFEKEKFAERNGEYRDLDLRLYRIMAWYWSASDLLCMGQKALVIAVGGYYLAIGELPVGTFYFFLAAVSMFIWPMRMMGRILTDLGKATVAIGRIAEILEHPMETGPEAGAAQSVATPSPSPVGVSLETAATAETAVATSAGDRFAGAIEFDDVDFSYDGKVTVLDGVSFRVAPGETLALLGPSGAGKSTIVSLLLRLYDPRSGTIRIDGTDVRGMERKAVRSQIAVVMQEPFLYSKTIGENIRLGRSSAADPDIAGAATVACVHESIMEFDEAYDTLVGERGVTLSGGQRQRVALARALLDHPAILILDDALSAVDTETESLILRALKQRRGQETSIVIAHRLSTVMHADRILVLDEGRVIQEGTHATLVTEDGLYRRLWQIQSAVEDDLKEEMKAASSDRITIAGRQS